MKIVCNLDTLVETMVAIWIGIGAMLNRMNNGVLRISKGEVNVELFKN